MPATYVHSRSKNTWTAKDWGWKEIPLLSLGFLLHDINCRRPKIVAQVKLQIFISPGDRLASCKSSVRAAAHLQMA